MRKMKLSGKLIGMCLLMVLMILTGGVLTVTGISGISAALGDISDVHQSSAYNAGIIKETQIDIQKMSRSLLISEVFENTGERDQLIKGIEEARGRAEVSWKRYEALPGRQETAAVWKDLKPAWESWLKAENEFIGLVREGNRQEALNLWRSGLEDSFVRSQKLLSGLSEDSMGLAGESAWTGMSMAGWLRIAVMAVTVLGIILFVCLGFYFVRQVTRPIHRVVTNLKKTSGQIAEAAEEIAQSVNALVEGTSLQTGAVEETCRVITSLTSENRTLSEYVQKLQDKTSEVDSVRQEAHNYIKLTAETMTDIKASNEETSGILQTIEKIAFQTNLLALNASVEAARAGDVGAGFAVVADEVRNLAILSAEAARNTTELISGTVEAIHQGGDLVETTSVKYKEYDEITNKYVLFMGSATGISVEQAPKYQQVQKSIAAINRVVQSGCANVEDAAEAAGRMSRRCEELIHCIEELSVIAGGKRQRSDHFTHTDYHPTGEAASSPVDKDPGTKAFLPFATGEVRQ